MNIIRDLQQRIKTEMNRLTTEFWDNKINNLKDIYNNPEKFWRHIRILKGSNKTEATYLINERNEKIFEEGEKFSKSTQEKT